MESRRCACCGRLFRPRVQNPQQQFCSAPACQRERRRRWQQAKRASDPDYRENQARAQRAWTASHRDYWAEYRRRNPAYCARNREAVRQRQRDRRQQATTFAKMDALMREKAVPSGTYRLVPTDDAWFAKMDAWTVEITVLSKTSRPTQEVCKERTR